MNAKVINYYEIDASQSDVDVYILIEHVIEEIHTLYKKYADSIACNKKMIDTLGLNKDFESHKGILNIVQSNRMPDNELEVRGIGDNTYIVYKINNIFN